MGEALKIVRGLRAKINELEQNPTDVTLESAIADDVSLLYSEMSRASASSATSNEAMGLVQELQRAVGQLSTASGPDREAAVAYLKALSAEAQAALLQLRQQTSTGAAA